MEFHANKALFKSDTVDPLTGLPVYVFDSNYLPVYPSNDQNEVEQLMVRAFRKIILRLPDHDYVLVCFTSGFRSFSNHWVTLLKCYQLFPDRLKEGMAKCYMVHESWLIRSVAQILANVRQLFKKSERVQYCQDLTELAKCVDITKIRVSMEVYLYDLQFEERLVVPYTVQKGSKDHIEYQRLIGDRVLTRLGMEGDKYELLFTKPGNAKQLMVLQDAIERGNYLDLSQWDIYVIGSLLLNNLRHRETALIPVDAIELPIQDDLEYTRRIFAKLGDVNLGPLFEIALNMVQSPETTRHDLKSLAKALTPALCKEKVSMKTNSRLLIGQRFIKNLLEHWVVMNRSNSRTIHTHTDTPTATAMVHPTAPPSRKVSPLSITKREPRPTPELPDATTGGGGGSITTAVAEQEQGRPEFGQKILSDVTNRPARPRAEKPSITGYSAIEGHQKVSKLAQLYEERLVGLQVLREINSK